MNINDFLHRINYHGAIEITLPVLTNLQQQFLLTVPFENLDIHRSIKLRIDKQSVFEKIVTKHRGGVCYESNALFYDALTALGFEVDILPAEMCSDKPLKAFYDHMTLRVHLNDKDYIVDVGNGRFFGAPIPVSETAITTAEGSSYQIRPFDDQHLAIFCRDDHKSQDDWKPRYVFLETPVTRESFAEACHYVESSPESIFTQSTVVTRLTKDGRITLSNSDKGKTLTVSSSGSKPDVQELTSDQFDELLYSHFNITL